MTSVVMIGATGAVGTEVVKTLVHQVSVTKLTLLGRREFEGVSHPKIAQHLVDVLDPATYREHIDGARVAICTLGVGEPSKVSKETFLKIDRDAVLGFASAARDAGVVHFELLASIGADSGSKSYFLRGKGKLEDGLRALEFERLSLFHPSMILTPTNRYGFTQAVTLAVWPKLKPLLAGPLRKFRGIEVERLGRAIALNLDRQATGVEILEWDQMMELAGSSRGARD